MTRPRREQERGTVPRWPFHALLVLPAAAYLWSGSYPGRHTAWWLVGVLGLAAGALVWAGRLVANRVLRAPWSWWFLVAPVAGALVLGLAVADGPLRARWELGRGELDAAARRVLASGNGEPTPLRLGTYTITSLEPVPGGVLMDEATGDGGTGRAGFAYLPEGGLQRLADEGYLSLSWWRPLGDGWYAWSDGS
ncbi:hypothetical protein [Motilibacter aurantiacus]|uniref:hypothetical protein n=1 Tax=Motilibacter aurantiacus TaxID=2714955 RepID=UPI00140AC43C|nr:hypothetical protein [Motilibacter aurantiacus]NHC44380.1 hypothetical protein [Motilibacter aurantiacus]